MHNLLLGLIDSYHILEIEPRILTQSSDHFYLRGMHSLDTNLTLLPPKYLCLRHRLNTKIKACTH